MVQNRRLGLHDASSHVSCPALQVGEQRTLYSQSGATFTSIVAIGYADGDACPRSRRKAEADGSFVVADIEVGKFFTIQPDGTSKALLEEIDGQPLGAANFATRDSKGCLWLTVSTRSLPWSAGIIKGSKDGYIVVIDDHGPRVVADGVNFANELRSDGRGVRAYG